MPSQRKRIGYLPSEEVHEIIDKLCKANDFSQSKVTGLLVEEALRSRGVLSDNFPSGTRENSKCSNYFFDPEPSSYNVNYPDTSNDYAVNKNTFSVDIKMMQEFIEFKYFKKVMKQNRNIVS